MNVFGEGPKRKRRHHKWKASEAVTWRLRLRCVTEIRLPLLDLRRFETVDERTSQETTLQLDTKPPFNAGAGRQPRLSSSPFKEEKTRTALEREARLARSLHFTGRRIQPKNPVLRAGY